MRIPLQRRPITLFYHTSKQFSQDVSVMTCQNTLSFSGITQRSCCGPLFGVTLNPMCAPFSNYFTLQCSAETLVSDLPLSLSIYRGLAVAVLITPAHSSHSLMLTHSHTAPPAFEGFIFILIILISKPGKYVCDTRALHNPV